MSMPSGWQIVKARVHQPGGLRGADGSSDSKASTRRHVAWRAQTKLASVVTALTEGIGGVRGFNVKKYGADVHPVSAADLDMWCTVLRKPPDERTRADLNRLDASIGSSVDFFKQLPPTRRALVLQYGFLVHLPKGKVLFRQGDTGHTFYVVLSGLVNVSVSVSNTMTMSELRSFSQRPEGGGTTDMAVVQNDDSALTSSVVATLGPLKSFGERALRAPDALRQAAISATEDTVLMAISGRQYIKLADEWDTTRRAAALNALHRCPWFQHWTPDLLKPLAAAAQLRELDPGAVILRQGAVADAMVVVDVGEAKVVRQTNMSSIKARSIGATPVAGSTSDGAPLPSDGAHQGGPSRRRSTAVSTSAAPLRPSPPPLATTKQTGATATTAAAAAAPASPDGPAKRPGNRKLSWLPDAASGLPVSPPSSEAAATPASTPAAVAATVSVNLDLAILHKHDAYGLLDLDWRRSLASQAIQACVCRSSVVATTHVELFAFPRQAIVELFSSVPVELVEATFQVARSLEVPQDTVVADMAKRHQWCKYKTRLVKGIVNKRTVSSSTRQVAPLFRVPDSMKNQVPAVPVPEFLTKAGLSPAVTSLHHTLGVPTPIDRPEVALAFQRSGETPDYRRRYAKMRHKARLAAVPAPGGAPATARGRLQTTSAAGGGGDIVPTPITTGRVSGSPGALAAVRRDLRSAFHSTSTSGGARSGPPAPPGLRPPHPAQHRRVSTKRMSPLAVLTGTGATGGTAAGMGSVTDGGTGAMMSTAGGGGGRAASGPAAWLVEGISRNRKETAALFELLRRGELDVNKFHPQPPRRPSPTLAPPADTVKSLSPRSTSLRSPPSPRPPARSPVTHTAPPSHRRAVCFHRHHHHHHRHSHSHRKHRHSRGHGHRHGHGQRQRHDQQSLEEPPKHGQ